jgi:hypothetical protein
LEQHGEGLRESYESIEADGRSYKSVMLLVFDGKDHPYDDPDHTCETVAGRRTDERHVEVACKAKGTVLIEGTLVLSESNNQLTMTQTSKIPQMAFKQVVIFDRQD